MVSTNTITCTRLVPSNKHLFNHSMRYHLVTIADRQCQAAAKEPASQDCSSLGT